jgi:hypothetical protein
LSRPALLNVPPSRIVQVIFPWAFRPGLQRWIGDAKAFVLRAPAAYPDRFNALSPAEYTESKNPHHSRFVINP